MTKRNRNIKHIFIMLQRGTNIMANQVKTPISKRCCMKIWHLRFLPCCFYSCQSRDKKNRNKPLRFSLHFSALVEDQLSPTCTLLASAHKFSGHFLQTIMNNKWLQSRQQNPTFVSWPIQKKSGKTPLETIPLYINLAGGHTNRAEMPVAIINREI